MREHEDDDEPDDAIAGIEEDRLCPFMIMGRSHDSLSEGVPGGAFSGKFSCIGRACMAYVPSVRACGMAGMANIQVTSLGRLGDQEDGYGHMGDGFGPLQAARQAIEAGEEDSEDTE
jgi:hypothetical protein